MHELSHTLALVEAEEDVVAEVAKAEVQKEEAKIKLALAQSTLSAAKQQQEAMLLLASNAVQQQLQGISASQAQLGFNLEHGPALEATAEFPAGITASEVEPTVIEQLRVVEAALQGGLAAQQQPIQLRRRIEAASNRKVVI
jgi:hypothetical protein